MPATVTRRLCTIAGFYKYAVEEDLLDHSPAVHVRRPRLDYASHATGLDRNEVGALLVAAGLATAAEHALVSLLALNGLRVSEATGADIEALGTERGHRNLAITRKGGKKAVILLAPRTARAIDPAIGERCEWAIFTTASGTGWTGTARADRALSCQPRRPGQEDRAPYPAPRGMEAGEPPPEKVIKAHPENREDRDAQQRLPVQRPRPSGPLRMPAQFVRRVPASPDNKNRLSERLLIAQQRTLFNPPAQHLPRLPIGCSRKPTLISNPRQGLLNGPRRLDLVSFAGQSWLPFVST